MEALCIEFITQCNQDLAQETWYTIYKLPTNPDIYYKKTNEWINWKNFLSQIKTPTI